MQAINEKQYEELALTIQKEIKQLEVSTGWECFAQGKVNGYKKKSLTNSVIIKASTMVNLPLQKVVDFFLMEDSVSKLNDMIISNTKLVEKKGTYKVFHIKVKTPFPLDNREMVHMVTQINEGNKFYVGVKSCNYPVQPTPKFVMAQMNIGAWIFEKIDENTTRIINISDMNPMGNIPDFLKNFVSEKKIQELGNIEPIIRKEGNI